MSLGVLELKVGQIHARATDLPCHLATPERPLWDLLETSKLPEKRLPSHPLHPNPLPANPLPEALIAPSEAFQPSPEYWSTSQNFKLEVDS